MTVPGSGKAASAASSLLPGFEYAQIEVQGVTVNHAIAGSGPPLLLLHGYPENHLMWRHVAPALAEDHTVVVADLRGYGDSGKPAPDDAGLVYSKRCMARDQVGLMRQLGFAQFGLVGHDRGARVAHRLVLDHPDVVSRLAVLDIVPTLHVLRNVTRAMATAYYHWFFLATPNGVPEHMIAADPGFWVRSLSRSASGNSTPATFAAQRCPRGTSCPKKHPTWSAPPCATSSASPQPSFRPIDGWVSHRRVRRC